MLLASPAGALFLDENRLFKLTATSSGSPR
jgi:hypothetical protein